VRVGLSFWFTKFKHQSTESRLMKKNHTIIVWNDSCFIAVEFSVIWSEFMY